MLFTSFEFIFVFLPVLIVVYSIFKNIKIKNVILVLFSLLFYAWGEPKNIFLLILLILLCYVFSFLINKRKNKYLLFTFIAILITPLIFYKYFYDSMPLGISFYTFQLLSYLIDVYTEKCECEKNIINLSVYLSMFPSISSGPILRYPDIKNNIYNRKISIEKIEKGLSRFIIGLSKKIIIADNLSNIVNNAFSINVHIIQANMAWLGAIAYMLQIYFDFSGYSDMAIGLGRMLGFSFKENFDEPYISRSITDFWRRWHISLSMWFRDYVYIPLGGNRTSTIRWIFNLLIVWILTGIWHGTSMNFIVWGLYYGVILIIEKLLLKNFLDKHKFISHIYSLLIIFVGWIIFRIGNVMDIPYYLFALIDIRNLGTINYLVSQNITFDTIYILLGVILIMPSVKTLLNKLINIKYLRDFILIILLIISVVFIENGSFSTFLYFKF